MRVVDTSAWIELLIESPTGKALEKHFPPQAKLIVPTIVQLELAKWLTREMGEDFADQTIAYTQHCVVVPLDTKIALMAAELGSKHKLATADSIVYATALTNEADLLTCDAHFLDIKNVKYVQKLGA